MYITELYDSLFTQFGNGRIGSFGSNEDLAECHLLAAEKRFLRLLIHYRMKITDKKCYLNMEYYSLNKLQL